MNVFIDPPYKAYYENRLFDKENKILNRDDTLAPIIRAKDYLESQNKIVKTADYLYQSNDPDVVGEYYSFGLMDNLDALTFKKNIKLKAFVISEPPVVAKELYDALPKLTKLFEKVYVHNVVGDGYSLKGVATYKLHKWYWPQPHQDVIECYWNVEERLDKIVVINGNHKPRSYLGELYSKRIEVMCQLAPFGLIDLYGRNWEKWYSRASMWLPYWKNRSTLMSIYKGSCDSKLDILSQYDFCLCFENMSMNGYVTEKIFDCLYAGTIPIYLGAHDIQDLIPEHVYIDFRQFKTIEALREFILHMTLTDKLRYKQAGRDFLNSSTGANYYNAMTCLMGEPG